MMTFQSQNGVWIKYILVYLSNVTGENLFGLKTVSDRRDSCRVCPARYLRISDRRVTNDRYIGGHHGGYQDILRQQQKDSLQAAPEH